MALTVIKPTGVDTSADFVFSKITVSSNVNAASASNVTLGAVGNVHISGGSSGQYLQTDGSGALTWATLSSSGLSNGNSNISIPAANGNVNISAVGNANILTVTGTGKIHGIDIDLHDVGELTPSIAALAALADSPSYLRGIGHLRLHETDRLAALTRELNSLGGDVVEEETALRINPAPLHGGVFHTYDDHRLATAGAVLGLAVKDIEVENIETTRKTLPDFPGLWSSLLA